MSKFPHVIHSQHERTVINIIRCQTERIWPYVDVHLLCSLNHGCKSRGGTGDESPRIWSERTLMQIVPHPDFAMFQNFKHQIACIKSLKKLSNRTTQRIHYLPKVHLQRLPLPLQAEIQHFSGDTDKNTAQNVPKHAILSEQSVLWRGATPPPHTFPWKEEYNLPTPNP